jgi:large subunit ribosomal protein L3
LQGLITRKVGMVSVIDDKGAYIPITLLSSKPNVVTQIKTSETDGYSAVQLGFEEGKKIGKTLAGHFKKSASTPKYTREFRMDNLEGFELGKKVDSEIFEIGEKVDVTGTSKGKGFAGTIKRHNFHRGRKTHGGRSYRRPGSIGSMYPQRIFPGKKMAGHMGHERVTTKRLKIAIIDKENSIIGVRGAVPGPRKGLVLIRRSA